jgi:hypothetical protein
VTPRGLPRATSPETEKDHGRRSTPINADENTYLIGVHPCSSAAHE